MTGGGYIYIYIYIVFSSLRDAPPFHQKNLAGWFAGLLAGWPAYWGVC